MDADTREGYYQLLLLVRTKVAAWGGNLAQHCTTSGLVFVSGRAVQFPVDAHCGLITTLWRNGGCVTWQPGATDLFFSPFCPSLSLWWLTKNSAALQVEWACWEIECSWTNYSPSQLNMIRKSPYISVECNIWVIILYYYLIFTTFSGIFSEVCIQIHVNTIQYLDFLLWIWRQD